jgi:hypothetical protein
MEEFTGIAKLFLRLMCLCDRCGTLTSIYRVICTSFSDNEAAVHRGFVDFLVARLLAMEPIPGDPPDIAPLNHQNSGVGREQMPVIHRA